MSTSMTGGIRGFLRNRTAVVAATATGFLVGAAGFAAADGLAGSNGAATTTTVDATSTTVDDSPSTTAGSTSTTTDATSTTIDDSPSTTVDDSPSTTAGSTSTTIDATSTTVDDDRGSVAPFTRTYRSSGGSITVTWNGSSLSLDAVSPEPGYQAEIEDNRGDRVRVDFESDDHDSRIEIRVDGDEVRERVEG